MVLYLNSDLNNVFLLEKKTFFTNFVIESVVIDSRVATNNSLFVAIKGDNNDGHNYIKQAVNNGAVCVFCEYITDEMLTFFEKKKINYICVESSINALQKLAVFQRNRLKAQIIAITGNVGKTTTREMFCVVLSKFYKVFSPEKNYNNHIGLPLTICNTPQDIELLILEMGMNNSGEIDVLTRIAKPDYAVITNITEAHIGNFKSILDVVDAKAEIFNGMTNKSTVILNMSNAFYSNLLNLAKEKGITNIISIGTKDSDVFATKYDFCNDFTTEYEISCYKQTIKCKITGFNKGNIINSLFVFAVSKKLGLNLIDVAKQFCNFNLVNGRGSVKNIIVNNKHIKIIDDCYNSSPTALKTSLDVLGVMQKKYTQTRVIAVIGDMLELGEQSKDFHKGIVQSIVDNQINDVVLIGQDVEVIFNALPNSVNKILYKHTEDFEKKIASFLKDGDIVLFKASRGMHFERLIEVINC